MRRYLFRLAAPFSLGLFLLTCAPWSRSYDAKDEREFFVRADHCHRVYVLSECGGVVVKHTAEWPPGAALGGERPCDWCRATETWDLPFSNATSCRQVQDVERRRRTL